MSLEKIGYKEFRSIHPVKGDWISYWRPGEGYFKLPKQATPEARQRQVAGILDKTVKVEEKEFIKQFSWIPLYIYNEMLLWPNEDKTSFQLNWARAVDRVLRGKPTGVESRQIQRAMRSLKIEQVQGKTEPIIEGKVSTLLYLWLRILITGQLSVRRCEGKNCSRIFTPSRKDMVFCSEQCRLRTTMDRRKKREELRIRKSEG